MCKRPGVQKTRTSSCSDADEEGTGVIEISGAFVDIRIAGSPDDRSTRAPGQYPSHIEGQPGILRAGVQCAIVRAISLSEGNHELRRQESVRDDKPNRCPILTMLQIKSEVEPTTLP